MPKNPRIKNNCYICGRKASGHWVRNAHTRGETKWRCMKCLRLLTGNRPSEAEDSIQLEPLYGRTNRNRSVK